MDENHEDFTIFYEALKRTALLDSLSRYRDDGYEEWKNNYAAFTPSMRIGNENYVGKRPDHRYSGFTLLIVPDKVLYEKYSDRFNESMTMDEKIDALYDLAVEKYSDNTSASIFGLDKVDPKEGKTYKRTLLEQVFFEEPIQPLAHVPVLPYPRPIVHQYGQAGKLLGSQYSLSRPDGMGRNHAGLLYNEIGTGLPYNRSCGRIRT